MTLEDKIVALARVCPAGTHMTEISIGRVITTERGKGYGRQIMLHAIRAAIEHFGATLIDIEAQEYAKGFYEGLGFKQSSDTFMPGSESEHRWQDEHPDGTFINK